LNRRALSVILILIVLIATSILVVTVLKLKTSKVINATRNNIILNTSVTSFRLFDAKKLAILRPIVQLKLSNGTIITVKDRNPFNFTIIISPELQQALNQKVVNEIKVYKVVIYKDPKQVFELASRLGIDTNKLYFNNVTETYIYYNDTHIFEYNVETGFLRFKERHISQNTGSCLPDYALVNKALSYLKGLGILPANYSVKVGEYLKVNDKPLVKVVELQLKVNGTIVDNLGLSVLITCNGKVVGLEGVIPADTVTVGTYKLKPLDKVLEDLKVYIKSGKPMTDWYISWLVFTKLYIKNVTLRYYVTPDLYVVPVYIIKGDYELNYDVIKDSGNIKIMMLAISG
jgi:hypothetical protein